MNILDDLSAFFQEHARCGVLDSEVQRGESGARVTLACELRGCHFAVR